jgi:uncharacterized membrane protein
MTQSPYGHNPFEAPQAGGRMQQSAGTPGVLDPVRAVTEGWESTKRNFGPWILMFLVTGVVGFMAMATIIGIFVVVPVLFWGAIRFTLNANDGQATVGDVFSGFSRYGEALGGMIVYFILSIVVGLPGSALSYLNMALGFMGEPSTLLAILAPVASLVWMFAVTVRLFYAPFFMLDQEMGAVEAMKASWEATRPQILNNILLLLLFIPVCLGGMLLLFVGIIPAMFVCYGALAAGYRQLTGTSAAPRTAF